MSDATRTVCLVALASVGVFAALAMGFAALGYAGQDQTRRALRWLLFALGAALLAGTVLGGLVFDPPH